MAKHNSGGRSRHFISRPLIACALVLILIAGAVVGWRQLGDRIDDETTNAEQPCIEGAATVSVIADPALAPALQAVSKNYNATSPVVRDHCVKIDVRPADARIVQEGLLGKKWDPQSLGAYPAAWVPESSVWSAPISVKKPTLLQGNPESLVTSPVRLAMEPEIAKAIDGRLGWADLPAQTRASSLAAYGKDTWGSLRIAMPGGPQSDATALAGQAVTAATVEADGPLTAKQVQSPAATDALNALMSAPPRVGDGSIEAAVKSIAATTDPSDAEVRAVPATEQRLFTITADDKSAKIAVVAPRGATPVADYPVVKLTGEGVPTFASDVVNEFFTFARKPVQMSILTKAGFRGSGPLPDKTATVKFDDVADQMPVSEPAATVDVSKIVYPAAAG